MDEKLQRARGLCLEQAGQFIAAADRLGGGADFPHIVYHLSLLALEEVGKASMLGGGMLDPDRFADSWVAKSLDNHRRKLQWAIWSPLTRIDPADFEAARQFAEHAHAMRLASLYVDPTAEVTEPPPDYAPTLGKMAATLAKIESHPAMQLTPEAFAYQVRQARDAAQQQGSRDMSAAIQRVDGAAADLARLAVQQRAGREQNRWLAIAAGVGAVFGVVIWVGFSGPIARALPAAWSIPERMAAATLRLDRWDAGARLMQSANAQSWARLVDASELARENGDVLEQCRDVASKSGRAQRCVFMIRPPANGPTPNIQR